MGLHLYNGALHNFCRYEIAPREGENFWEVDQSINRVCTKSGLGNYHCPSDRYCAVPSPRTGAAWGAMGSRARSTVRRHASQQTACSAGAERVRRDSQPRRR